MTRRKSPRSLRVRVLKKVGLTTKRESQSHPCEILNLREICPSTTSPLIIRPKRKLLSVHMHKKKKIPYGKEIKSSRRIYSNKNQLINQRKRLKEIWPKSLLTLAKFEHSSCTSTRIIFKTSKGILQQQN